MMSRIPMTPIKVISRFCPKISLGSNSPDKLKNVSASSRKPAADIMPPRAILARCVGVRYGMSFHYDALKLEKSVALLGHTFSVGSWMGCSLFLRRGRVWSLSSSFQHENCGRCDYGNYCDDCQ